MYGLPKDFDGSMFIGRTIELVSFSVYQIFFSFDQAVSITMRSSCEHQFSAGGIDFYDVQNVPVEQARLMQLVGRSVESVEAQTDGTLTLHFSGGHVLRCFDDTPQYESYQISNGPDEIYV